MPEIEWKTLKEYVDKGLLWKTVVSQQAIAVGRYFNIALQNPSTSSPRTITFLNCKASADYPIWANARVNATISGTLAAATPVNAMVGCSISSKASVVYGNGYATISGGDIFFGDLISPSYIIALGAGGYGPVHITEDLVVLNRGSSLTITYGPVSSSDPVTLTFEMTWTESSAED